MDEELIPNAAYLVKSYPLLLVLAAAVFIFDKIYETNYMFLLSPSYGSPLSQAYFKFGYFGYLFIRCKGRCTVPVRCGNSYYRSRKGLVCQLVFLISENTDVLVPWEPYNKWGWSEPVPFITRSIGGRIYLELPEPVWLV